MSRPGAVHVAPEVGEALRSGAPVVALESTVIAHGLPAPANLDLARRLEEAVREEGAVPATIGVVGGRPIVGLSPDEIERLGTADGVAKAGPRDLAPLAVAGRDAATTVAGTLFLADRAGIPVLATGGIGGVHRGGELSLDVSADLGALAAIPVAVVCAGAKAILDLERTLEVLETLGVPVLGLGTGEFPAFYTAKSGLPLEHALEGPDEVAVVIEEARELGLRAGPLVCQPPPRGSGLPPEDVETWIARADREAAEAGVSGKALTPWLLARLAELSGGRTVQTNVALLENNARAAARIAAALAARESRE